MPSQANKAQYLRPDKIELIAPVAHVRAAHITHTKANKYKHKHPRTTEMPSKRYTEEDKCVGDDPWEVTFIPGRRIDPAKLENVLDSLFHEEYEVHVGGTPLVHV